MLVLDTNHVDVFMFEHPRRDLLIKRLEAADEHTVSTTIITVQENLEGWLSKINQQQTAAGQIPYYDKIGKLIRFFQRWDVLPFDEPAAAEFMRLKQLRLGGVGTNDLKIAAIALCHNAIVLTRNTQDFLRIPNLMVEDWLADNLP